jgi:hypothetical protein
MIQGFDGWQHLGHGWQNHKQPAERIISARIKKKPSKVSLERPVEPPASPKPLTEVLPIVAKRPLLEWFLCATAAVGVQRKPLVNLNGPDP